MTEKLIRFMVDGVEIECAAGRTILQACDDAGIYIPRLCYHPDLSPGGHCRLCQVRVNGRNVGACYTPVTNNMVVENETPENQEDRRRILEMLFVSGRHVCAECEKSGECELQASAYRLGMAAPTLPYLDPVREIDATHPDIYLDRTRCILCGRCVRASRTLDGKGVFAFRDRGLEMEIAVDSLEGLGGTDLTLADRAAHICPVGSIVVKRVGFRVPVGQRRYDQSPIGADIEARRRPAPEPKEE